MTRTKVIAKKLEQGMFLVIGPNNTDKVESIRLPLIANGFLHIYLENILYPLCIMENKVVEVAKF